MLDFWSLNGEAVWKVSLSHAHHVREIELVALESSIFSVPLIATFQRLPSREVIGTICTVFGMMRPGI